MDLELNFGLFLYSLLRENQDIFIEQIFFLDCQQLDPPTNGALSPTKVVHHGVIVKVTCHSKFTLTGTSTLRCVSGNWSGNGKVGTCEPGENINEFFSFCRVK